MSLNSDNRRRAFAGVFLGVGEDDFMKEGKRGEFFFAGGFFVWSL